SRLIIMDGELLTEVPQNLQTLVRLVVRGFYTTEDVLIIDMLVRNCCMSEEDLCDLLKFDRKMLRQRINTLRADKFIQARMKMVTLEDNKTQKEQYYFIDYKSFVNVVKYKLDHIRKKLEMKERDQTSRASFICHYCQRSYTDLEVENIKLAAKFSEPQPKDFSDFKKPGQARTTKAPLPGSDSSRAWSGDATKKSGFQVEGSIDVNINADGVGEETVLAKEKPIWLSDATSLITTNITTSETSNPQMNEAKTAPSVSSNQQQAAAGADDVMMLLQAHERKSKKGAGHNSDSESEDSADESANKRAINTTSTTAFGPEPRGTDEIELIDSDDDDDDSIPQVSVAGEKVAITEVDNHLIAKMTLEEKNSYMLIYQDYIGSLDD
ncbi:hypothetical protein OTU49_017023, partial [Cherax quadricarinatus]